MTRLSLQKMAFCLSLLLCANAIAAPTAVKASATAPVITYTYELLAERSHKKHLFTQGLIIDQGHFYESSGLYGRSMLVSYPVAEPENKWAQLSAKFTRETALAPQYFAEGLTLFNDKLYLLTWHEQTLLIYNRKTFALEKTLNYSGEGWGLAHNETHLIRSDGSHKLTFHEPQDFKPLRVLAVHQDGKPVEKLNELEFIDGKIWANIWYENRLVEIDPQSGEVVGEVDLSGLTKTLQLNNEQVLNGIAYDAEQKALWVTGKLWPKMFLIKLKRPVD